MDLAPYVDHLRRELAVAAAAGGEEARAVGERLAATLESATRLALLEALSAAADEITHDLAPGSVEVRLRGRDPGFVVTPPLVGGSFEEEGERGRSSSPPPAPPPDSDEGGTSRISLRVPEHLKPRIEEAAARDGLSVNAWLVRAVSAALDSGESGRRSGRGAAQQTGKRYSGWVR
ncbi:toxin-antitoxin system HicB family antitoxin [Nonomuraea turkmeniaca]|uniref:Toxin-antitoxin system HicB family antitoxin n=1 Tax=Nonomuraea turkmeniaca TaxID=103838 RepID=A0A5S4FDK9_9ACTN|nr:toxin-antitoxin system HicB family antitoxin [Nonomuraea turkmeniaca]TMR16591.1 toxin-antitoxin system HicB family antitoxin [Nonomuraea turkmeniaca]